MSDNPETIRPYRPGDEEAILTLRGEILSRGRDREHWNWQFRDHAHGPGWMTLAEIDGRLVGQHAVMRGDLSNTGRRVTCGQSCDTMVREQARGRGLFARIANEGDARAAEEGCRAIWGFPNRNSFPILFRHLDWYRITVLKYAYVRLGLAKVWGRGLDRPPRALRAFRLGLELRFLRRFQKGLDYSTPSVLPEALEPMLREIMDHEILSVWKDLDYLRWRYERHPHHDYRFHLLSRGDEPQALVVTRDRGNTIAVCEILHRAKNVPQTALLLKHVIKDALGGGAQQLEFYGHDAGFFEAALRRGGFAYVTTSPFDFGGRFFGESRLARYFVHPQNWTISYGDSDIV